VELCTFSESWDGGGMRGEKERNWVGWVPSLRERKDSGGSGGCNFVNDFYYL